MPVRGDDQFVWVNAKPAKKVSFQTSRGKFYDEVVILHNFVPMIYLLMLRAIIGSTLSFESIYKY